MVISYQSYQLNTMTHLDSCSTGGCIILTTQNKSSELSPIVPCRWGVYLNTVAEALFLHKSSTSLMLQGIPRPNEEVIPCPIILLLKKDWKLKTVCAKIRPSVKLRTGSTKTVPPFPERSGNMPFQKNQVTELPATTLAIIARIVLKPMSARANRCIQRCAS
jgi:hypothetical protein